MFEIFLLFLLGTVYSVLHIMITILCFMDTVKAKLHYTSLPVASPQQVGNFPNLRGSYGETCLVDSGHNAADLAGLYEGIEK